MGDNKNLSEAKRAKSDEFYTQYADIEKEMNAYIEYNPEVFKDKTILLPCDDPEWSNFTKYFVANFNRLGLKKLISTSYAQDCKPFKKPVQLSLLEMESKDYDPNKTNSHGKIYTLTRKNKKVNKDDLKWKYLEGNGDFRSEEVQRLCDECDIVITNPPFSLFREFLSWLGKNKKQYIIIGNQNCITYKEVFPLFQQNKIWLGESIHSGDRLFYVPIDYPLNAQNCGIDKNGIKYIRVKGVRWITNVDHGGRHEPLQLMTMEDNRRYNKKIKDNPTAYCEYDNYNAIECPTTDCIPSDYEGLLGVPITFFDKYCPEQFEIIGSFNNSNIEKKKEEHYVLSENTPTNINGVEKLWNGPVINKQPLYKRIVIKLRR